MAKKGRGAPLWLGAAALLALAGGGGGATSKSADRSAAAGPPDGQGPRGRIGRFFTWREMTASRAARRLGLLNVPPPYARVALRDLVDHVLDPLRQALGRRVIVNSGYRSPAVNRAVGGYHESQHMRGEAADIAVPGMDARFLAEAIVRQGLPFDQVIWYAPQQGGHVHVSWRRTENRRQTLLVTSDGRYVAWRA